MNNVIYVRKSLYDKVIAKLNTDDVYVDADFLKFLLEAGCESVSIDTFKKICYIGDYILVETNDYKFDAFQVICKSKCSNQVTMLPVNEFKYNCVKSIKDSLNKDFVNKIINYTYYGEPI